VHKVDWVESEGDRWREYMVPVEPMQCKNCNISLNGQKQLFKRISLCGQLSVSSENIAKSGSLQSVVKRFIKVALRQERVLFKIHV